MARYPSEKEKEGLLCRLGEQVTVKTNRTFNLRLDAVNSYGIIGKSDSGEPVHCFFLEPWEESGSSESKYKMQGNGDYERKILTITKGEEVLYTCPNGNQKNGKENYKKSFLREMRNSLVGKVAVCSLVLSVFGYGCGGVETITTKNDTKEISEVYQDDSEQDEGESKEPEKESWPVGESLYDQYIGSPIIANLIKNGKQQVIVDVWHGEWEGEWKKRIYVLNEQGSNLEGWPKDSLFTLPNQQVYPSFGSYRVGVGDLEGDGPKEVIYWDRDETNSGLQQISAFHYDGLPAVNWPIYGEKLPAYLISEDFNNDGKAEVFGVDDEGKVWLFQSDGKSAQGWPKNLAFSPTSLKLADIDNNGDLEIISVEPDQVQAWGYDGLDLPGYPLNYKELNTTLCTKPECEFISPLFLGDADQNGNLDLIIQTRVSLDEENYENNQRGVLIIDALDKKIKYEWPLLCSTIDEDSSLKAFILSGVGDIDQDSDLELIFDNYCQKEGTISIYHHDGGWLTDLILSKEDAVHSSGAVMVADLDAALGLEIVNRRYKSGEDNLGGAFPASLQIYNGLTGKLLRNVEFGFKDYVELGWPAVGDLDGDGNPDLVESGYVHYVGGKVNKWEFNL